MANGPREIDKLRRLTVWVVLGLLVFVVVGNYLDDVMFDDRYTADAGLFTLMGGIIAGLFAVEAIVNRVSKGPPKDEE